MRNVQNIFMEKANLIEQNVIEKFNGEQLKHLWFTSDNHLGR
jgi:hypothetical protein